MPVEQNLSLFRQPLIAQTTQLAIYTKYVTNASKKTPKKPKQKAENNNKNLEGS